MLKKISLFILLFCFPFMSYAEEALNPVSKLQTALDTFQSLSARFTQTLKDKGGASLQESQGTMIVHRPSQFRWETTEPNQQLIVTNGDTLWIYDKDLDQVTIQSFKQTTGNTPALLMSGDLNKISQDFTITIPEENPLDILFRLTSKIEDNYFQWIELNFKATEHYPDKVLTQMTLVDNLGQITHIEFSNVIKNPKLKSDLFDFTPPKGVDVIEMQNHDNG